MTPGLYANQPAVLAAIDQVIAWCTASQAQSPDAVVQKEMEALKQIRTIVSQFWPLSDNAKNAIVIGPVAAKNIADWNEPLANALMVLDAVLKNNGQSIEKLGLPNQI